MLGYDQRGLLPVRDARPWILLCMTRLGQSLSASPHELYPLAGRLATSPSGRPIYIHCNDAGPAFIEASAENLTMTDPIAADVPVAVGQLFALNANGNIEGHRVPLLAVQVTKLRDGICVTCSLNHSMVDGASLWDFFKSWAEICSGEAQNVSINPIYDLSTNPVPVNSVATTRSRRGDQEVLSSSSKGPIISPNRCLTR